MTECIVLGLPRSGTNYIEHVVRAISVNVSGSIYKHTRIDESTKATLERIPETKILLVARHPVLWIESLIIRAAHEMASLYGIVPQRDEATMVQLARLYERFYGEWLAQVPAPQRLRLFEYEKSLSSDGADIIQWLQAGGPAGVNGGTARSVVAPPTKLRESAEFSREDYRKNIEFHTSLTPMEAATVMGAFGDEISNICGYSLEQLRYIPSSDQTPLRDLLYQIAQDPEVIKRVPREIAVRVAQSYPDSSTAHLVAHVASRDSDGYSGGHLEDAVNALSRGIAQLPFSGAELTALVLLFDLCGEKKAADRILAIIEDELLSFESLIRLRAQSARRNGRRRQAESLLRLGLMLHPRHTAFSTELATLLKREGKLTEALRVLNRAVGDKPRDSWLRGTRASVLLDLNRLEEAEGDARLALDLLHKEGQDGTETFGIYLINLALIVVGRGRGAEAKELVETLDGKYPPTAWAYSVLAQIFEAVGEGARAHELKSAAALLN